MCILDFCETYIPRPRLPCITPIVRIQASGCDSLFDCKWFVPHCSPHTGAIYLRESSELNVTEGGRLSFVNNHARYGGKYYHPYPRYTTNNGFLPRSPCLSRCLTSLICSGCPKATNPSVIFLSGAIRLFGQSVFHSYGTASFVSNEAEYYGGAMYKGRTNSHKVPRQVPKIGHLPRPNLPTLGIQQCVLVLFPVITVYYRGSN